MEKVIKSLSKNYKILLFGGGKNEVELLDRFQNKYENTINLAGQLSLDIELDVISNLDALFSLA